MIFVPFLLVLWGILKLLTLPLTNVADVGLDSAFSTGISTASEWVHSVDEFIPIHELLLIFAGTFVLYEVAYFTYKLIMWVVRKIPTIS